MDIILRRIRQTATELARRGQAISKRTALGLVMEIAASEGCHDPPQPVLDRLAAELQSQIADCWYPESAEIQMESGD